MRFDRPRAGTVSPEAVTTSRRRWVGRGTRLLLAVAAAVLAATGLAACGGDDAEDESAEVEEVAIAYGESEGADACRFMSASALDQLGGESGCTREFELVPSAEFDIQEVTVEEDTATASVENVETKNVIELTFVKQDDEWRISEFPGLEAIGRPPGGLLPDEGLEDPLQAPTGPQGDTTGTAPDTETGPETETEP